MVGSSSDDTGTSCNPDVIVTVISKLLSDLVARNDQVRIRTTSATHSRALVTVQSARQGPSGSIRIHLLLSPLQQSSRSSVLRAVAAGTDAGHALPLFKAPYDYCEELPRGPVK
tara:strand:- start:600 stop:941 length:342 start_codon:yes stop_codon:yes gene_type:complete